jgi:hypothetical protein
VNGLYSCNDLTTFFQSSAVACSVCCVLCACAVCGVRVRVVCGVGAPPGNRF